MASGDIDFDELDKAVTSLMGGVKDATQKDDTPQPKTLTISSTLKPGEQPEYNRLDEVAKRIGKETLIGRGERTTVEDLTDLDEEDKAEEKQPGVEMSSPKPPVADIATGPSVPAAHRPKSGRFMDVVHPSSDMRAPAFPVLAIPERYPVSTANSAPRTPEPPENQADRESPLTNVASALPPTEPLTPFLPDAKVEKRPLGENSTLGAIPSPFEETERHQEHPRQDVPADTESAPVTENIPEVLEEGSRTDDQAVTETNAEPTTQTHEEKTLQAIESGIDPSEQPEPETEASIRAVESGDTEKLTVEMAGSYLSEKTLSESEDTGAIYDVKEYHQPLQHPPKHKSGWMTVVMVVAIILVVCIIFGVATYFILGAGA